MLPKFLLLATFCALAANIIGKEICGKDQLYCSNIMNAKRCNAVKYCIQSVWEHQILPDDNGDICNICKDMVSQARAHHESNETQGELKQVFEGSCKLIPVKIVSEECIKLADEFIPELVETMESQMNPKVVCSVTGLCNSIRNDKLHAKYKRQVSPLLPAEQTISSKAELTHLPLRSAEHVNGGRKEEGFGMENEVPEVTTREEVNNPLVNNPPRGNFQRSITCMTCKFVAFQVDKMLKNNATEGEIKDLLGDICYYMPNPYAKECNEFVDQYTPRVINYLAGNLDPNYICPVLTLCSYNFYYQYRRVENEVPEVTTREEVNNPLVNNPPRGNFQRTITCMTCKIVTFQVDKIVKNNATEGEIKDLLGDICYYMLNPYAKECNEFVDQYTPRVIKYLAGNLDPNYICPELTLCNYDNFERFSSSASVGREGVYMWTILLLLISIPPLCL